MILRVDPAVLAGTARPLREAVDVARQVESARGELVVSVARAGSEQVRRSTESFLDAWATGLTGLCERGEALAESLDTAAAGYAAAEERLRRAAATAPDGGQDGGPP